MRRRQKCKRRNDWERNRCVSEGNNKSRILTQQIGKPHNCFLCTISCIDILASEGWREWTRGPVGPWKWKHSPLDEGSHCSPGCSSRVRAVNHHVTPVSGGKHFALFFYSIHLCYLLWSGFPMVPVTLISLSPGSARLFHRKMSSRMKTFKILLTVSF